MDAAENHSLGTMPEVEILYFEGCPNREPAQRLVEEGAAELGITMRVVLVNVPDIASAERERFLGSPTIRVGVGT